MGRDPNTVKMKPPAPPRQPAKPLTGSSSAAGTPAIPVDGGHEPGFRDGFGEREASVDADGHPVELLRLLRGFNAVAPALSERIARLKDFHRTIVAEALRLDHDEETGQLTLVSERPPGLRLRDLLRLAAERSVTPNVGATLLVMRRLLSTAESLHRVTGVTFTAVAPERIVLTPRGEIVLVEPALAGAIETITATSYEPRRDIAGIALVGISMLLGRPSGPVDALDALSALLKEAADAAALVAGDTLRTRSDAGSIARSSWNRMRHLPASGKRASRSSASGRRSGPVVACRGESSKPSSRIWRSSPRAVSRPRRSRPIGSVRCVHHRWGSALPRRCVRRLRLGKPHFLSRGYR